MSESPHLRTVLVTGSAKRLGREIALALAAGGWQVAIHYRRAGADAAATVAACRQLAGAGAEFDCFGAVDAVVNNASLFEHDSAQSLGYDALCAHLRTNTGAPVLLSQALHEHVRGRAGTAAAGSGVVVNLLDQKLWNPNPDFLSYTLSKAALEAANTVLAMALAPQVRVVGVAPGLTLTSHLLADEKFEQLHRLSPLGRSSTAQDVASAVKFALENSSITGTTLLVDGGQHLMKFSRDFSMM
jgi:NAD(P)-dependent dehydrogenase (short-subunit alcohol dehydrogenase family)